jgi:tetratricopeptide (TPR) repeat protein
MRLIPAILFVVVAGAVGWFAGSYLGLVGGPTPDELVRTVAPDPQPAGPASPPPDAGRDVSVVVPGEAEPEPARPVATPRNADTPLDLTAPRSSVAENAGAGDTGTAVARPRPVINPALPEIDESALRYFARTGDQRRLDAEMARLKLLYPEWVPPANPAAPEVYTDPELDRMWQLFAEEKYAEVRAAIAERRGLEDWQPPAALVELLDQADSRVRLVNASNARQWNTVIDTAAAEPSLLTCAYVDVLWRVAEAFANTDRVPRARDTYVYILSNCENAQERVATVEKAMDVLPAEELPALLAFGRGDEFAPVDDILLRRRVSATSQDPDLVSPASDLDRLAVLAEDGDVADALLLGWYYYRHAEPRKALEWFDTARKRDPESAKAVEGYTLSLIELDRFGDAEAASYDWRDSSEDNLAAYLIGAVGLLSIDPPARITEPVLQRMSEVIVREKSLQGAEQMGWYAYNLGQIRTASRWFETVLRWDPEYEPGAYGLAVVRLAMNDLATVDAIKRDWAARSQRIADVGRPGRTELRGSQTFGQPLVDGAVDAPPRATRPTYPDRPVWVPLSEAPRGTGGQVVVREAAPALPYAEPGYAERPYVDARYVTPTPVEQAYVPRSYADQPYAEPPYPTRPYAEQPYEQAPYVERPYVEQAPAVTYVETPVAAAPAPVAGGGGSRRGDCGTMSTPTRSLSPAAALSRGWCLMDLNRPVEAAAAFDVALGSGSVKTRSDAAYGASLANLRSGVTDKAWIASASAPMTQKQQTELNLSILSQQAEAAYADGRYIEAILALDERARLAPEQTDLMVLRGWSYFKLNRLAEAKRIFEAAAQTGYPEARSGIAAVYEMQTRRLK